MEVIEDGQSAAEEPTTHTFAVGEKVFTIIDTPGIGVSDEEEQERESFESILSQLPQEIHCICILLKPNNARLVFSMIVEQVVAHLGKDIAANIVICFTHASSDIEDQANQTLLPALKEELHDQGFEVDQSHVFFFDNGALRFLACIKEGIEFPEMMFDVFSSSWTRAVQELNQMLELIETLKPYRLGNSCNIANGNGNGNTGAVANFVPGVTKGAIYSSEYLVDEEQFLYRNKMKKHSRRAGDCGRFLWECIEKGCHASASTELREGDGEVERLVAKGKFAHSHPSDPGKVGIHLISSWRECLFSGSSAEGSCWCAKSGSLHQASGVVPLPEGHRGGPAGGLGHGEEEVLS